MQLCFQLSRFPPLFFGVPQTHHDLSSATIWEKRQSSIAASRLDHSTTRLSIPRRLFLSQATHYKAGSTLQHLWYGAHMGRRTLRQWSLSSSKTAFEMHRKEPPNTARRLSGMEHMLHAGQETWEPPHSGRFCFMTCNSRRSWSVCQCVLCPRQQQHCVRTTYVLSTPFPFPSLFLEENKGRYV